MWRACRNSLQRCRSCPSTSPTTPSTTGCASSSSPDRSAPVIGVAVLYDVGIRSEPRGPHRLRAPLRAPHVPGLDEPREARALPLRAVLGRHVQRQHPHRLHQLLRGAAVERARARAVPRGRPDALAADHRGEPGQPARRGEERDPGQRAQPPVRRVPVDLPAGRPVRQLRQLAQRVRRLRGSRERDRRRRHATSSRSTTRRATPCWPWPATSMSTRRWR